MNHPTCEEWMSYLYDELDGRQRASLTAHLRSCQDCGARINEWRATRKQLGAWRIQARAVPLPDRRACGMSFLTVFKWAAAATVVLGIGISVGRLTSTATDVQKVRAALEPEVRQQLRQEFAQRLRDELGKTAAATLAAARVQTETLVKDSAAAAEARRVEDNRAVAAGLSRLETQHNADYLSLKQELDTVAVNTDADFRQTEQQLVQLADFSQAISIPNSSKP